MAKRIAVIGAGLSGIAAIKQLSDEGHDITCYEKMDGLGGVFGVNEIYEDLHLTISNYFMAYSDDVPTKERLKFWSKAEYRRYLMNYVDKFGIEKCISFKTQVKSVRSLPDDKWEVTVVKEGVEQTRTFDVVAVCSGLFQEPKIPQFPGLDRFQGEVIHSKYYRDKSYFEGKRVLCVGMGESSADITSEISSVAERCVLSLRRYHAVAPRYMSFQEDPYFTIDTSWLTSRIVNRLPHRFHAGITKGIFHRYVHSRNPDLRIRGEWLMKAGPSFNQAVTKNERLFKPIADGKVIPNIGGIKAFDETGVTLMDGTREEVDAVVCCTGYKLSFPFLNVNIDNMRDLFKQMFLPDIGPSLAFIGFARPQQGGVPAIAEMQSRYLAQLCSGKRELPSLHEQKRIVKEDAMHWQTEYCITPKCASLVNYCHYMDSLAELVGCMPEIPPLWRNPRLRIKLLHGPQFAAQYRLRGPHANSEAAQSFIMSFPVISSWRRVAYLEFNDTLCRFLAAIPRFRARTASIGRVETAG